jgi:hypothetical protein
MADQSRRRLRGNSWMNEERGNRKALANRFA